MDKSEIKDKLVQSSSQIFFNELKIDILKDVIILVSPDLILIDVAESCALDDQHLFQNWVNKGLIKKPRQIEIDYWKKENTSFNCCIVKPFIFIQKASLN